MYNLRSRKNTVAPVDSLEESKNGSEELSPQLPQPPQSKIRKRVPSPKTTNKHRKLDLFDANSFTNSLSYEDIVDSSDSDDSDYSEIHITDTLRETLQHKFPQCSPRLIEEALQMAIQGADFEEEENDHNEEENLEECEELLQTLREHIQNTGPTLLKILRAPLVEADKEQALMLYDVWKNLEPTSLEAYNLRIRLLSMIQSSEQDQDLLQLRIKRGNQMPSLDGIMKARLTENDKIRALELYEVLGKCEIYTTEWFDVERRLKEILASQFDSDLITERIEAEEASMLDKLPNEHATLKKAIFELDADVSVKTQLYGMYCDMINRPPHDSRYQDLKDKIRLAIKLPHRKVLPTVQTNTPEEIQNYCLQVYKCLDADIYGMKEAKEQIIQTMNDRIYNPNSYAILALKGAPGLGKTKLAKTIAKAVGLPFDKISLGGVIDSTIFKGSDNVWSGAGPSMLLQILSRVKYANAVILLDEIDKLGTTEKGREVQYALLHILDRTQNKEFQDLFLNEYHHDISKIWFIAAMNDDSTLDPALKDRLHIIKLPTYTHQEMIEIIKRHTFPETLVDKGILPTEISITDEATSTLIKRFHSEIKSTGMRSLERVIADLISKLNLLRSMNGINNSIPMTFSLPDFKGFPYTITETTINALCKAPKSDTSAFNLIYS